MTSAASGISAVITRSPGSTFLTISASATSKPEGTCMTRTLGMRGTRSVWLATRVTVTPVRSAALNSISLTTFGQASASTQIRGAATTSLSAAKHAHLRMIRLPVPADRTRAQARARFLLASPPRLELERRDCELAGMVRVRGPGNHLGLALFLHQAGCAGGLAVHRGVGPDHPRCAHR